MLISLPKKDVIILGIGFFECLIYAIVQQFDFDWHNYIIYGMHINVGELMLHSVSLYILFILLALGIALLSHSGNKGSYYPTFINALKKSGLYIVPCMLFLIICTEIIFSSII